MMVTFVSQYINTGLLLLIVNARFSDTPLSFVPIETLYSDYTSEWYTVAGPAIV